MLRMILARTVAIDWISNSKTTFGHVYWVCWIQKPKFMWPDAVRRRVWECREWFIESQVYTYSNTSLWSRVSLVFVRPHRVKQVHRGFGELFSNTVEDASSRLDLTHHDGLGFYISTVVSWGGIVLATETVDVSNWNILQSVMIFSWSNSWGLYGWKLCWMGGIWKISISIVEHDCSLASLHNRFSMLFQQQSYSLDVDSWEPTKILGILRSMRLLWRLIEFHIYQGRTLDSIPSLFQSGDRLDSSGNKSCLPFKNSIFWGSKVYFKPRKHVHVPPKKVTSEPPAFLRDIRSVSPWTCGGQWFATDVPCAMAKHFSRRRQVVSTGSMWFRRCSQKIHRFFCSGVFSCFLFQGWQ